MVEAGNPKSRVWGVCGNLSLGCVWESQIAVWGDCGNPEPWFGVSLPPPMPSHAPQRSWCRDSSAGSRASPIPSQPSTPSTTSRQVSLIPGLGQPSPTSLLPLSLPWTNTQHSDPSLCSNHFLLPPEFSAFPSAPSALTDKSLLNLYPVIY